jgi:hypothetical protein
MWLNMLPSRVETSEKGIAEVHVWLILDSVPLIYHDIIDGQTIGRDTQELKKTHI